PEPGRRVVRAVQLVRHRADRRAHADTDTEPLADTDRLHDAADLADADADGFAVADLTGVLALPIQRGTQGRHAFAGSRVTAHPQPVRQQQVTAFGEHRLGVELHALDREVAMTQTHDDTAGAPRGHVEYGRQRGAVDGERVIAGGDERIRQATQHP